MSKRDRIYDVNGGRLALLLLPTRWRRPLLGSLAQAAMSAPARLIGELRGYRREMLYRMEHNGQVCRLRGALNDEFDPAERRMTIEDGESGAPAEAATVWRRGAGRWVMLPLRGTGAVMAHRRGFGGTSGYDFWVNVPRELAGAETRIRGMVDMYKLASKRYTINYI